METDEDEIFVFYATISNPPDRISVDLHTASRLFFLGKSPIKNFNQRERQDSYFNKLVYATSKVLCEPSFGNRARRLAIVSGRELPFPRKITRPLSFKLSVSP